LSFVGRFGIVVPGGRAGERVDVLEQNGRIASSGEHGGGKDRANVVAMENWKVGGMLSYEPLENGDLRGRWRMTSCDVTIRYCDVKRRDKCGGDEERASLDAMEYEEGEKNSIFL
uniref:YDG domain-containing protein n=1 Tax=Anisakis simplex TaxID=6269 RepID=A0A0M3KE56_ANISI